MQGLRDVHFSLDRLRPADLPIFFRRRGDTYFRELTFADYRALRDEFINNERLHLLEDRGAPIHGNSARRH
ncbi:MAG: hypothetical protein OXR73_32590 [Myxococcales bacterium]|nr:hypothetical protein [Myxococcales bacterium]